MNQIRAIFFDLDHTLWDYEQNSEETLTELFHEHELKALLRCSSQDFLECFQRVNARLWDQYNHHQINRDTIRERRFSEIFKTFDVEHETLALELSDLYINRCPTKSNLLPFAREALDYLSANYPLHILSNGFDDVQAVKLASSNIRGYFGEVITSETTGHRKPSAEIFRYACARIGMPENDCLMVGDNYHADILGAMGADLSAMYYNPLGIRQTQQPHFDIKCLSEIPKHL
ncbi:YjjG family noncanonical pyrimidine nucleotidase [Fulvivirga sedimenti]|uniref:YjjG family noncanonical pyrimidine nucleotidase n=1 Tax=Fulvivirga sedimenti TaxID=2879465 RepID=A0A9X1HKX6_9BACT|nr:YjjG family noncanonical pyrimidine nucleotidase [Fulvivirga sedimenti]MCA6074068.1 YjjG family noncanonical pyrimidine nucleotidase [Fulvivirga sedimenti]